MKILEEDTQLKTLNEIFVNALPGLSTDIENSIYYSKLKTLLHSEIFNFCREFSELKSDLNILRMMVGDQLSEDDIREYLDTLKDKYNNGATENVGLEYHIEATRIDYGVPVFVVIKRDQIYMKKFVFRFKKSAVSDNVGSLSAGGTLNKGR